MWSEVKDLRGAKIAVATTQDVTLCLIGVLPLIEGDILNLMAANSTPNRAEQVLLFLVIDDCWIFDGDARIMWALDRR